jgi:uncharacterized protein DUF262
MGQQGHSTKPSTLSNMRGRAAFNHSLFLPHIQRPFVWEEEQMLRLFDSLMRNYPIQTLLFWRTKDEIKARKFMEQVDWDADLSDSYERNVSKEGIDKVFVLDGQQRLQTLYAIFFGAITSPDNKRAEAYFDITSGIAPDEQGLMYKLQFSTEPIELPCVQILPLDQRRYLLDRLSVQMVERETSRHMTADHWQYAFWGNRCDTGKDNGLVMGALTLMISTPGQAQTEAAKAPAPTLHSSSQGPDAPGERP